MSQKTNIQLIGKRISTLQEDGLYSFVIIPTENNWKTNLLFIWFLLWSVSGCIMLFNYFTLTNPNTKLVVIVWLGFWAYFEFKTGKTYFFKKFGKEKIWIKNGVLNYWRDIAGRGKKEVFQAELIKDLQVIEKNKRNFFQFMNESFWVLGGESISFSYGAKLYRIGIQLKEDDSKELLKQLKFALKER